MVQTFFNFSSNRFSRLRREYPKQRDDEVDHQEGNQVVVRLVPPGVSYHCGAHIRSRWVRVIPFAEPARQNTIRRTGSGGGCLWDVTMRRYLGGDQRDGLGASTLPQ